MSEQAPGLSFATASGRGWSVFERRKGYQWQAFGLKGHAEGTENDRDDAIKKAQEAAERLR